jgi:hypothetical protein
VARFEGDDLRDARFVDCQLDGAEFREVTLVGARFIGAVLIDVEIDALVQNLTVNGVDVVPFVEAELDRRHPERLALRPTDVEGARKALDVVDAFWAPTVELVRSLRRRDINGLPVSGRSWRRCATCCLSTTRGAGGPCSVKAIRITRWA